jgi:hypothetical protein
VGVTAPGEKPRLAGFREVLTDPNWWMRDVFTALLVGVLVAASAIIGQKWVDDERSDREGAAVLRLRSGGPESRRAPSRRCGLDRGQPQPRNLTDASLARANVTDVFYDAATVWPRGFTPPPSRAAP